MSIANNKHNERVHYCALLVQDRVLLFVDKQREHLRMKLTITVADIPNNDDKKWLDSQEDSATDCKYQQSETNHPTNWLLSAR
jgi:hypothetical protein